MQAIERIPDLEVDGGFVTKNREVPPELRSFLLPGKLTRADYLWRTRQSMVAFNTPAVHDCPGWKLGEYLALGKAIISTKLGRVMPGDFEPGRHLLVVDDGVDAFREAVEKLRGDPQYRAALETADGAHVILPRPAH